MGESEAAGGVGPGRAGAALSPGERGGRRGEAPSGRFRGAAPALGELLRGEGSGAVPGGWSARPVKLSTVTGRPSAAATPRGQSVVSICRPC